MKKWRVIKLGDVCFIKGGKRLPNNTSLVDFKTSHPYIKARDIGGGKIDTSNLQYLEDDVHQKIKRYIVNSGDICITIVGANIGDVGVVPNILDGANLTENAVRLTSFRDGTESSFIGYVLSQRDYRALMEQLAAGAAQPKLGLYKIRNIQIQVPSSTEQKKIASILSAYDDLIENNKRRIAILEKMAEEIYREWFVRMRFPASAKATAGKSATSTIPEGWRVAKLRDVVSNYIGGGWGEDNESAAFSEGAYVIRGTDIPDVTAGKFTDIPYRFHKPSNLSSRRLQAGDFVFEVSGGSKDQLLGRNVQITEGLLQYLGKSVMCASFCKLIRFDKAQVLPEVMKYFLKLYYDQDLVSTFQVQSTGISNYQFESFLDYQRFVVPALSLQQTFSEKVLPMLRLKDNLSVATINLTKTRDLLLPRLISGKLSVENLELPSNVSASAISSALPQAELAHA